MINHKNFIAILLSALLAAPIFLSNLGDPSGLFWDENYHIPSAQRYLSSIFFMEPHPPLGKLLIALGEYLLDENQMDSSVASIEKAATVPDEFSFKSYRLFPAIAGWLAAPFLTWALILATSSAAIGFFVSTFYIFENGIVLHSRGAMLDSFTLLFAVILLGIWFLSKKKVSHFSSVVMGLVFGLGIATKLNFIFLAPLLLTASPAADSLLKRVLSLVTTIVVASIVFISVFAIHFNIGRNVVSSLPDSGWYETSPEYRSLVTSKPNVSLSNVLTTIKEWLAFTLRYQEGVPKLNYCKEEENGSFPLLWPLGARSINYKWESKDDVYKILYLQVNPLAYAFTLMGLLITLSWSVSSLTNKASNELTTFYSNTAPILASYFLYMGACLFAGRVFYLYHYFIPWLLSLFCFALVLLELSKSISANFRNIILAIMSLSVGGVFYIYSPLTFYGEVSESKIGSLGFFKLWNLHTPHGVSVDPIARHLKSDKHKKRVDSSWSLSIGELKANYIEQEWGTPRQNLTDEGNPIVINGQIFSQGFGVHAKSRVQFDIAGKFARFKAQVGVPDMLSSEKTSVKFKVLCDGEACWESAVIRKGSGLSKVEIDIGNVQVLSLVVEAAGDGNDSDHAVWVDPALS